MNAGPRPVSIGDHLQRVATSYRVRRQQWGCGGDARRPPRV